MSRYVVPLEPGQIPEVPDRVGTEAVVEENEESGLVWVLEEGADVVPPMP